MTAELLSFLGSESTGQGTSTHEVTVILRGEVEAVRARLVRGLEQLEYTVIEEQPLLARRPARGGGKYFTSSDILDYSTKLHIGLKSSNQGTTLARFTYGIEFPYLGKGDKQTLNREAEAVCALARQSEAAVVCPTCGTERTQDSRFCRRCGTSLTEPDVAELEILRMTAKSSAAFDSLLFGLIFGFISLFLMVLASIPGIITKPKLVIVCWIFASLCGFGWVLVVAGMRYLYSSIHDQKGLGKGKETTSLALPVQRAELPAGSNAEPLFSGPPSVTENTTELLEAQPVRLPNRGRDTK